MEAEKKRNETVFYVILALAVLIAGAAAWFYFSGKKAPEAVPPQISQPVDMSFLQNLEGNYSMKMTSDGETSLTSASVQRIADDRYSVTRVTVYGPMHYSFSFSEDGSVFSEELGAGFAAYKAGIDKTTIRFEKENIVCELTR